MGNLLARLPTDRTTRLIILAVGVAVGLAFLARIFLGGKPKTVEEPCLRATVVLWAPFEPRALAALQKPLRKNCLTLQPVQKSIEAIAAELVPALASGQGPTLAYVDYDFWSAHRELFVSPPPPASKNDSPTLTLNDYPTNIQRAFGDRVEAYPFSYDTLVLIWNRDLLHSIGQAEPPTTFEALDRLIPQLRRLDAANQLILSPIALGGATNIPTHFELFLALWRMGHPGLERFSSGLGRSLTETLDRYTDYVRGASPRFSWHPNLPNQREALLAERTSMIIDFVSARQELLRRNPRAPLSLAPLPAYASRTKRVNYLRPFFLAVTRGHDNPGWQALIEFDRHYAELIKTLGLPPIKISLGRNLSGDNQVLFEELIVGDLFADINKDILRPAIRSDIDNWLANRRDVEQLIQLQQVSRFFK